MRLDCCIKFDWRPPKQVELDFGDDLITCLDTFELADKLCLPELQTNCFKYLQRYFCMDGIPSCEFIIKLYSLGPIADLVRQHFG
jgi:hypothetical protein